MGGLDFIDPSEQIIEHTFNGLTATQQSSTPVSSISSTTSNQQQQSHQQQHDPKNLYNQYLLQNHMFGQLNLPGGGQSITNDSGQQLVQSNQNDNIMSNLAAVQQHLLNQNIIGTGNNINNNNSQQQPLIMENNLLLQINADNQPGSNSEILQQLYNYSQMSGELIK